MLKQRCQCETRVWVLQPKVWRRLTTTASVGRDERQSSCVIPEWLIDAWTPPQVCLPLITLLTTPSLLRLNDVPFFLSPLSPANGSIPQCGPSPLPNPSPHSPHSPFNQPSSSSPWCGPAVSDSGGAARRTCREHCAQRRTLHRPP